MDASLFNDTAITERTNLHFRAEFFNVPNHANFGDAECHFFERRDQPPAELIPTTSRQILKLIF